MALLALVVLLPAGCVGSDPPDPRTLLDSAFAREALTRGPVGPASVEVANLGFGDRVLEARIVPVTAPTHRRLLEVLASDRSGEGAATGLASLADDLETGKGGEVSGVEVYPVRGTIETGDLIAALEEGGGSQVGEDLGVGGVASLRKGLRSVEFTAWVSKAGSRLERLDLTIALDDPGNALPPSRIRFRLDGDDARPVGQDVP